MMVGLSTSRNIGKTHPSLGLKGEGEVQLLDLGRESIVRGPFSRSCDFW